MLIKSIPVISIAKPMSIIPIFFFLSDLETMRITIPTKASIGAKVMGFKRVKKKLSPFIPVRLKRQAVRVVPTFEPIIIPKVSQKFTIPEFTSPTSITVIAEEDCIAMVTPAPKKKLKNWFLVTFLRVCSSAPPVRFSRPPERVVIPYRKKARPPKSSASISKI